MRLRVLLLSEPAGTNLIGLCVAGVSLILWRVCAVGACLCWSSALLLLLSVLFAGVGLGVCRCCLGGVACVVCLLVFAPWFLRVEPL